MVAYVVEKQIVMLPALGEILFGVINHPIRADGADRVHIPGTAYAGHVRAETLGDLHRERAHASRGAVDQDLLSRPNLSLVAKTLQGGECRDAYRSRLLERQVIRLGSQRGFGGTDVLREGPTAPAEHLVARFELRCVPANRFRSEERR